MSHSQLFYIAQTLNIGVLDQIIDQIGWDGDEAVNRIIYYFLLIQDSSLKTQKLLFLMTIECIKISMDEYLLNLRSNAGNNHTMGRR